MLKVLIFASVGLFVALLVYIEINAVELGFGPPTQKRENKNYQLVYGLSNKEQNSNQASFFGQENKAVFNNDWRQEFGQPRQDY